MGRISKNRWKSPLFWLAVAAIVFFVLKVTGLLNFVGISKSDYDELIALIISILVGVGFF